VAMMDVMPSMAAAVAAAEADRYTMGKQSEAAAAGRVQ